MHWQFDAGKFSNCSQFNAHSALYTCEWMGMEI